MDNSRAASQHQLKHLVVRPDPADLIPSSLPSKELLGWLYVCTYVLCTHARGLAVLPFALTQEEKEGTQVERHDG